MRFANSYRGDGPTTGGANAAAAGRNAGNGAENNPSASVSRRILAVKTSGLVTSGTMSGVMRDRTASVMIAALSP